MILLSILFSALLLAPSDTSSATGGAITLAASTKKNILVVRVGGKDVKTYDVSVGTKKFPTPSGTFRIDHIVWNPAWVPPPDAKWAKGKQATAPGDKKNPMKVVKIFFKEPDYYIHGTGDEDALGGAASHGCIRMSQADAFALGRYLMDNCGAPKDNDWYAAVFSGGTSADIRLPRYVPIVIGP